MHYFIVNPAAKSGTGKMIWQTCKEYLAENNITYKIYKTTTERNATIIAGKILDSDTSDSVKLIVVGGDGTINEVLQAMKETDFYRVCIGYIPAGSSNDLARALQYSSDPIENLKRALYSDSYAKMDVGLLTYNKTETLGYTKRFFLVSCGIGFDASVCEEAMNSPYKNFLNRLHLGKLTYVAICIKQLLSAQRLSCTLTVDEQTPISLENCYFVAAMNHPYQGGGIKFCPDAIDGDGYLDICYAHSISKGKVLTILPLAFSGKHVGKKGIGILKGKRIHITYEAPLWVHTDGEAKTRATDITLECLHKKLRFVV